MVKSKKHREECARVVAELRLLKEKHGCSDCKTKYPHYVLEFDHRPGEHKIDNVARVLKNYGTLMAWKEVAKCDIVCSNCHKVRTYDRANGLLAA